MSDRHVIVSEWSDIDTAPELSESEKQRVATIVTNQSWKYIVWVSTWLLEDEDKEIETVEASDHIVVGNIENYSEKAWLIDQPHEDIEQQQFLPKSAVVVFERLTGVEAIDTPQIGLTSFAGDRDD